MDATVPYVSRSSAVFDEPNLVSAAGLVPVLGLAERAGLRRLADEPVTVPTDRGAHAGLKVATLVAGMVAGADSIEDMDLLRHGGDGSGVRRGTRAVDVGLVPAGVQVRACAPARRGRGAVGGQPGRPTPLLPGAGQVAYVDLDDTIRPTYGYAKQGAGYGYTKVKGLNALIGDHLHPGGAPVIAATRLRKGSTNSARGAARLVADALAHRDGAARPG